MKGSLTVVGTGIRSVAQTTLESRASMEGADRLLYLVADPVTEAWLRQLNPTHESLADCYREDLKRIDSYHEMVARTLAYVRRGEHVCLAFYGHPGVFVYPSHKAVAEARAEGFDAVMLAGVSAEDCLFADLGIDPADHGCQSFEATDFLMRRRRFDPTSHLILWQIGVVGEIGYRPDQRFHRDGLAVLVEYLLESYPANHQVTVYEAAQYAVCDPIVDVCSLERLLDADVTAISTLYVPPRELGVSDPEMLQRLGLKQHTARRAS
ncbi:MAG: hypothetical protein KDD11_11450 [Acidobacteria bacterium]|nr:hypothetical protein [Acidobacteriota bacterium]